MDCQAGDQEQIPVHVDKPGFYAILRPHSHSPGNGKGTVKPGGTKHSPVAFYIEAGIQALLIHLRILFHLEGWGIAVAGYDLKPLEVLPWDHESKDGRPIPCHIVFSSRHKLPFPAFRKRGKSLFPKDLRDISYSMEAGWAFLQEFQEFFVDLIAAH